MIPDKHQRFCYDIDMEANIIILLASVVIIAAIIISWNSNGRNRKSSKDTDVKKFTYKYRRKEQLMTDFEAAFFRRLEKVAGDRYYIFPQIHLSSILDHKIKGQDWRAALSTIQRKSVDYVLCSKDDLRITYAIELDDSTHDRDDRIDRDRTVERILADSGIVLVRFRNTNNISDEDIKNQFIKAVNSQ